MSFHQSGGLSQKGHYCERTNSDPNLSNTPTTYGYVARPAIAYRMGNRTMLVTAMTPLEYIGTVGERAVWDPLSGTGTNRKEDRAHRQAIAEYIETTPDYV